MLQKEFQFEKFLSSSEVFFGEIALELTSMRNRFGCFHNFLAVESGPYVTKELVVRM